MFNRESFFNRTMTEPLAYLNGEFIPAKNASISVEDAGFVQGTTVAEQLRSFGGELFRLEQHLDRLIRSLDVIQVDAGMKRADFVQIAERLARHNHQLLKQSDDLGLSIFVTPGVYNTFATGPSEPLVGMHTYPIPFHLWNDKYDNGQPLVITDIKQVPEACWSPALKCRSRMHYFLADRMAQKVDPKARALLLDTNGFVTEASTASIVIYRADLGLVAPPVEKILPGISLRTLKELALQNDIPFLHRDIAPQDVVSADEAILCSTSPCLLPATSLDKQPIGKGESGPVFNTMLASWSEMVGIDIRQQAHDFANRVQ